MSQVVDITGKPIEAPVFKDVSGEAADIYEFTADLFSFVMNRSPSQCSMFEIIGAMDVIKNDIANMMNEDA